MKLRACKALFLKPANMHIIILVCPYFLPGMQAYGHDQPAHAEPRLPQGGTLPQLVPEAGQSPAT